MMRRKPQFHAEKNRLRDLQTAILTIEDYISDPRYDGFKAILERNLEFTHQQYADLNAEMRRNGWNG
jgi:hypothetical protein